MTAYIVLIRNETHDPEGMNTYAGLAAQAPLEHLRVIAAKSGRFEVLEGDPAEAVAILAFPGWDEALGWYRSDEYQRAVKHRLAAGSFRTVLVEGVDQAILPQGGG